MHELAGFHAAIDVDHQARDEREGQDQAEGHVRGANGPELNSKEIGHPGNKVCHVCILLSWNMGYHGPDPCYFFGFSSTTLRGVLFANA
jgi:hypothetical protein